MAREIPIIWLDSVDSTNTEVYRRADRLDNMSVIAARDQTAGRGQRGNSWLVDPGTNLTFSMYLRFGEGHLPPLPAEDQFVLGEAATLAVARLMEEEGIDARIKWPNDIYVRNRKICGMLIENSLEGRYVRSSIVGIGVNCNQTDFPPQLANPVSMKILTGRHFELEPLLCRLAELLRENVLKLSDVEGRRELREAFLSKMYRIGQLHDYTDLVTGEVFKGTIVGLGKDSRLKVRKEDGSYKEFAFKEISYIL